MGNMNPVNRMVGNIMPIMEISMAVCWLLVTFEMSRPRDKQVIIKIMLSIKISTRLPLICTFKQVNG